MSTFTMSTGHTPDGLPQGRWLFSLELAHNSSPACVDADLLISARSHQSNNSDNDGPIFNIPVGRGGRVLRPGPEHAIKVRLDDGSMRLHWVNEFVDTHSLTLSIVIDTLFSRSSALTDANETLHAELNVRLTYPVVPPVPTLSPDNSDTWSQVSSLLGSQASTFHSEPPPPLPPLAGQSRDNQTVQNPDKKVFTSLRKGGRYR